MSYECTRRSLLQLLGITIGAAAVIPANLDVEPTRDEPIEVEQPRSSPTQLERFIRSHGIKPAHLARESGYSRQHLLRLRFGRMQPAFTCIAALVNALGRLTRERVRPEQLFDGHVIRAAWRDAHATFEDYERAELRAAFGQRTLSEFLGGQA